jgi:hypothetical protein
MKKILFVLAVNLFAVSMLQAQKPEIITSNKPGWHKIGEANVDFKTDKDQFLVMGADKFRSIQLKVKDAPVHIDDMQVYYDGGRKENVSLRSNFKVGSESRVINLKNRRAGLKRVAFVYHTIPNHKADKGRIELWGLK